MEATKEVVIANSRFQISRVDAETGSFLLYQVLSSLRKVMQEEGGEDAQQKPEVELPPEEKTKQVEDATMAMIENMLMSLDRSMFGKIQRDALNVCGQYTAIGEVETIVPVLMVSGKVAIPALRTDFQTLVTLTRHSLHFNLLPFFSNGGFKTATT
jgi:hypothetical protein